MSGLAPARTFFEAHAFVWHSRNDLVTIALLPVLVLAGIGSFIAWRSAAAGDAAGAPPALMLLQFAGMVASLLFYAIFSVGWHRLVLIPGEHQTGLQVLRWSARHTRFLMRSVGIFLILVAIGLVTIAIWRPLISATAATGGFALVAVTLLVGLTYARLAIWLPATAVDDPMTLAECWARTRGKTWALAAIVILWPAPALSAAIGVRFLVMELLHGLGLAESLAAALIGEVIAYAANFAGVAVALSALAIAYRDLKRTLPVPQSPGTV